MFKPFELTILYMVLALSFACLRQLLLFFEEEGGALSQLQRLILVNSLSYNPCIFVLYSRKSLVV